MACVSSIASDRNIRTEMHLVHLGLSGTYSKLASRGCGSETIATLIMTGRASNVVCPCESGLVRAGKKQGPDRAWVVSTMKPSRRSCHKCFIGSPMLVETLSEGEASVVLQVAVM